MASETNWEKWQQTREARSAIDALEVAPERNDVRRWRKTHLGEPTAILSVPAAKEWARAASSDVSNVERRVDFEEARPKAIIHGRRVTLVYDTGNGPLHELFALADVLHAHFGWTIESAAGWLLTGGLPRLDEFEIRVEPEKPKADQTWRTVYMKIPAEIPPTVVADRYREVWETLQSGKPTVRGTPITEKSLQACLFAIRRNDGRQWAEVFGEWEQRRKQAAAPRAFEFASAHDFAHAARSSYKKLTGEKLVWKRSRGRSASD